MCYDRYTEYYTYPYELLCIFNLNLPFQHGVNK